MLPFAFNTLRQAALNYQMNGVGPTAQQSAPPPPGGPQTSYMLPYPSLDSLLGYRAFGCPPRFIHEEPKPQHSYIGLIAMGILSNPEHKMVLSDIYNWILDNYPYFRSRGPGWRNSIRHNLSLNDCFVKSGRSANGKGHYWAIHPANIEDFRRGDFRRRRAQKKVRKYNGLSVPDDDDDSDESPTPSPQVLPGFKDPLTLGHPALIAPPTLNDSHSSSDQFSPKSSGSGESSVEKKDDVTTPLPLKKRKLFDMASILAPEKDAKSLKLDGELSHPLMSNMTHLNAGRPPHSYGISPHAQHAFWSAALSGFGNGVVNGNGGGIMSPWAFLAPPINCSVQAAAPTTPPITAPSPPLNAQLQWQETIAKIMGRSYRGVKEEEQELKLDQSLNSHSPITHVANESN